MDELLVSLREAATPADVDRLHKQGLQLLHAGRRQQQLGDEGLRRRTGAQVSGPAAVLSTSAPDKRLADDAARLQSRFEREVRLARQRTVEQQRQQQRAALLGTAAATGTSSTEVSAASVTQRLRDVRNMMTMNLEQGSSTLEKLAAANANLDSISRAMLHLQAGVSVGKKTLDRMKQEHRLNAAFVLTGFGVFLATVAFILWRRRSILKPVFALVVALILAAYVYIYRRFLRPSR